MSPRIRRRTNDGIALTFPSFQRMWRVDSTSCILEMNSGRREEILALHHRGLHVSRHENRLDSVKQQKKIDALQKTKK